MLTDETADRIQFSGQFVQPVHPHLVLQHATLEKPREVLQLLNNHEAQQSIQARQPPRSDSSLDTHQSNLLVSEQAYCKDTGVEPRCLNTPSLGSPVMDENRMRPDHWLGSALCVSFSALLVG